MPAKKNTSITKKAAVQVPQEEVSTREMILRRSLELINTRGMVEFRIDTLATSLGLSPGNITYHFSRKEDICVALWDQYLEEYGQVVRSLTTLLDIKQLYLLNRISVRLNYKYRGVVVFRSADLGAMNRDMEAGRVNEKEHFAIARRVMTLLGQNGYLDKAATKDIIEGTHTYHYIMMRWCINFAYQAYEPDEVEAKLDYLALMSLHALYPTLSKKGQDEFAEILTKVSSGNLLGE